MQSTSIVKAHFVLAKYGERLLKVRISLFRLSLSRLDTSQEPVSACEYAHDLMLASLFHGLQCLLLCGFQITEQEVNACQDQVSLSHYLCIQPLKRKRSLHCCSGP